MSYVKSMWPWGHLAVAYLLYSAFARRRYRCPPTTATVLAALAGSQFPDLIDKPLAWTFGILPGGRTLAHSLLFAAGLSVFVLGVSRAVDRQKVGVAFLIGHLSHVFADLPPDVVRGDLSGTTYLFWPILEPSTYESTPGIVAALLGYSTTSYGLLQVVLVIVSLAVWYHDRMPGLRRAWRTFERVVGDR